MEFKLVLNQSEKRNYNSNLVEFNKIQGKISPFVWQAKEICSLSPRGLQWFPAEQYHLHWGQFCNINDTFNQVIWILINWHISTGNLTMTARAILVKISVDMWKYTSTPMTSFKVSFMLQNFSQCSRVTPNWVFFIGHTRSRHLSA